MVPTQLDMIRRQSEAVVHNEVSRSVSSARRDTSLVNQATGLMGRTVRESERTVRSGRFSKTVLRQDPSSHVSATEPAPVYPASDGYIRRSPVQPLYEAADYRRKLVLRIVGGAALILAACAGIYFLMQLGLLGR